MFPFTVRGRPGGDAPSTPWLRRLELSRVASLAFFTPSLSWGHIFNVFDRKTCGVLLGLELRGWAHFRLCKQQSADAGFRFLPSSGFLTGDASTPRACCGFVFCQRRTPRLLTSSRSPRLDLECPYPPWTYGISRLLPPSHSSAGGSSLCCLEGVLLLGWTLLFLFLDQAITVFS